MGRGNVWVLSGTLKIIGSLCCGVRSKKEMNHSILINAVTGDAASHQNPLTTRCLFIY